MQDAESGDRNTLDGGAWDADSLDADASDAISPDADSMDAEAWDAQSRDAAVHDAAPWDADAVADGSRDAGPGASPDAGVRYQCAVRPGEVLRDQLAQQRPFDWGPGVVVSGAWPLGELPAELQVEPGKTRMSYWVPLRQHWAWFWQLRDTAEPNDEAGPWFFALVDASNRTLVGPREISAWKGLSVWPAFVVQSETGHIAIAYESRVGLRVGSTRASLLIDAANNPGSAATIPGITEILALKSTPEGDFALLLEKPRPDQTRAVVFARLSAQNQLREASEPVAESRRLGPVPTIGLIPVRDGYVATWEEHDPPLLNPMSEYPKGTRIKLRYLDFEGHPRGDATQLPSPALPFQIQLRWAPFQEGLGLVWTESKLGYLQVNWTDHEPNDEDLYRFMLFVPSSAARSNVVEIPRTRNVWNPSPFVKAGDPAQTIWVQAEVPDPPPDPSAPPAPIPVSLSKPVPIDCRALAQ